MQEDVSADLLLNPVADIWKSQRYATMVTLIKYLQWRYGLTPKQIVFENKRGEDIRIQFGEQTEIQSENDEIVLKEIRFLLDLFAISDQAYHEIKMKTNDMPKFYLIKNCRDRLNESIQIV